MNKSHPTSTDGSPHVSDAPASGVNAGDKTHNRSTGETEPTAVSLGCELEVLRSAIQGAQILVDVARHGDAADEEIETIAPQACSAMLTLVGARMKLVMDTIASREEVRLLVERHNAVRTSMYGIQQDDILLPIATQKTSP